MRLQTPQLLDVTKPSTEKVRCLGCAAVYVKPRAGGTITTNPGCPHCGYLGWAGAGAPAGAATLHGRFGAGHPRNRSDRQH